MPDAPVKDAQDAGNINSEVYFDPGISAETVKALKGLYHSNSSSAQYPDTFLPYTFHLYAYTYSCAHTRTD
jgi:hypothetical protein